LKIVPAKEIDAKTLFEIKPLLSLTFNQKKLCFKKIEGSNDKKTQGM
jgi:hypothetical protein